MSNNKINSSKRNLNERPENQPANKIHRLNDSDKFKMLKVMETPNKPAKDRKDYRIVKLNNGITALIISDPSPIIENKREILPNNIALSSVNNIPRGGIEIKCKNNEDLVKIHEKAMEEMADGYTVVMQKIRKPKVRITNMCRKLSGDEIIECMRRDNEFLKEADMKVLYVYDIKNTESYGTIIELDPKTFKQLMREGSVVIGTNKCNVTECLNVLRCYKCCRYHHKANVCVYKTACLRCGEEHQMKDCRAKSTTCINCKVFTFPKNEN